MNTGVTSLTGPERSFLRDLAWAAVRAAVTGDDAPDWRSLAAARGLDPQPRLCAPRGAFVTLSAGGNLRGCIGVIRGEAPLAGNVVTYGRAAAVGDPRFEPVTMDELGGLELEVSALTPLVAVDGPAEVEVGRHGVLLARDGRQSVFLPQVAPEQGWDRDTMLTHLALKAGLAPDAWRRGASLAVFEAEVF